MLRSLSPGRFVRAPNSMLGLSAVVGEAHDISAARDVATGGRADSHRLVYLEIVGGHRKPQFEFACITPSPRSSFVDAGRVGPFPMAQAPCDDLGPLHGRLAHSGIFHDLATHALALFMQPFAQYRHNRY